MCVRLFCEYNPWSFNFSDTYCKCALTVSKNFEEHQISKRYVVLFKDETNFKYGVQLLLAFRGYIGSCYYNPIKTKKREVDVFQ